MLQSMVHTSILSCCKRVYLNNPITAAVAEPSRESATTTDKRPVWWRGCGVSSRLFLWEPHWGVSNKMKIKGIVTVQYVCCLLHHGPWEQMPLMLRPCKNRALSMVFYLGWLTESQGSCDATVVSISQVFTGLSPGKIRVYYSGEVWRVVICSTVAYCCNFKVCPVCWCFRGTSELEGKHPRCCMLSVFVRSHWWLILSQISDK